MSLKSGSKVSGTHMSQWSHPSMHRMGDMTPRPAGSTISLFWGNRLSAAFRTGKGGFKVPRYQNTYRLAPYNPFDPEVVDKILEEIMKATLTGIKYQPDVCLKLCQDMSAEVRSRICKKGFDRYQPHVCSKLSQDMTAEVRSRMCKKGFDRYKYIVTMSIFEKTGQAIHQFMGRLWDVERDTWSTYNFESPQLIGIGTVFGLYYE